MISGFQQAPLTYFWNEIDEIYISKNHLTVKSGAANGIMYDLKDFQDEDVQFLKKELDSKPAI